MNASGPLFVFFDFDGTIAETEHTILESTNRMFQATKGLEHIFWDDNTYRALLKVGNTEKRLAHYFDLNDAWPAAAVDRTQFVRSLKREKDNQFSMMVRDGSISFRPGVERLLQEALDMNVRVAVVSNTLTSVVVEQLKFLLRRTPHMLDQIKVFGGDKVPAGKKKPSPDLYLTAASFFEMESMNNVLVFEDSATGLEAAKAAGISNVIVTPSLFTRTDNFAGATLVMDNFDQKLSDGNSYTMDSNKLAPHQKFHLKQYLDCKYEAPKF